MISSTRRVLAASAFALAIATATTAFADDSAAPITETEVCAAQKAWGAALVAISIAYDEHGIKEATRLAEAALDGAYGYNLGPVLFKPTLTRDPQTFRTTREGALAYFVGHNRAFPNDDGFALKHWRSVEIRNIGIQINGSVATTMGKVMIRDRAEKVTTVDKTWTFKKSADNSVRIVLHHSSEARPPAKPAKPDPASAERDVCTAAG